MALAHLRNSPLVEAIIEITFPGEPIISSQIDRFFDFIREDYPMLFVPNAVQGVAPALQPWEFKNVSQTRSVGLSVNSFTYRVQDYIDYKDFRDNVLPLARKFFDLYNIERMNRFAARYVNNIVLLRLPGQPLPLKNYLNIGLDVPEIIDSSALEDIHLQFSSCKDNSQVVVNLHHKQAQVGIPESLVLILDCAIVNNVESRNLEGDIDNIHLRIEDCFKALTSEAYMKYMIGDEEQC